MSDGQDGSAVDRRPASTANRQDTPVRRLPWILHQPLLLAGIPFVVFIATLVAVSLAPSWQLKPLQIGAVGESVQPLTWSPDGTRFLAQRSEQLLVVRARDGEVLAVVYGRSPVWVDDHTIDLLRDSGPSHAELFRLDLNGGPATIIGSPLDTAQLLAAGGSLAAVNMAGSIKTVVLNPVDGHRIASLPNLRAINWIRPGVLVAKTVRPDLQALGTLAGSMVIWTANGDIEPIAADLAEVMDTIAPSPSGDAFACICAEVRGPHQVSGLGVYKVDLEAGAIVALVSHYPTNELIGRRPLPKHLAALMKRMNASWKRLAPWTPGHNGWAMPAIAWLDPSSLLFIDAGGMHRVDLNPDAKAIPGIDASKLVTPGNAGRVYRLDGGLAVIEQKGGAYTGLSVLSVLGPTGDIRLRQSLPSWNPGYLALDSALRRAVFVTDPQLPTGPEQRFMVLAYE